MAKNLARSSGHKKLSKADAQAKVIELIQQGSKVEDACRQVERTEDAYRQWMKSDPEFKATIQ